MSDVNELAVTDQPSQEIAEPKRDSKTVNALTVERAQAINHRVIQRRIRLIDRYNGISIPGIREGSKGKNAWDGKIAPGDPPGIQAIFYLGEMLKEAEAIEDPYNRLNVRAGIMKQIAGLCEKFEDQNSKVVAELQKFIEMEKSNGMPTDEELAKIAKLA